MGKTCLMIDVANHLGAANYPALFLRGACIEAGIAEAVGQEVEWALGGPSDPLAALRHLSGIINREPLVIMVDALEDWGYPSRFQNLAFLVQHCKNANVRLILTCKSQSGTNFLTMRGSRTGIQCHIYLATAERAFSHEVLPWIPQEFNRTLRTYRRAFGFDGGFDSAALKEAQQSPFILRLLFQVARHHPTAYLGFNSTAFFERYVELAISKTSSPEVSLNALVLIADAMFHAEAEWLDEQTVRDALRLGATEVIPPDLFEQRLLVGTGRPGARRIGFALGHVRNYLAAFHARSWPSRTAESFGSDLESVATDALRAEVVAFYYQFAADAHRAVVDRDLRLNARAYLRSYRSIVEHDFPALKTQFAPETRDNVGFVAELFVGRRRLGMHGFRPIGPSDQDVVFLPVFPVSEASASFRSSEQLLLFHYGAEHLHWVFDDGFRSPKSVTDVLVHEICPQLRAMLEKGRLNEAAAPLMIEELLVGMISSSSDLAPHRHGSSGRIPAYPLSLADALATLRRADLRAHFEEEVTELKRERGLIRETWNGGRVSYSPFFSPQERATIEERVEDVVHRDEPVTLRVRDVDRERLKKRLAATAESLGISDYTIPSPSPLLLWALDAGRTDGPLPRHVLIDHCRQLFEVVLDHYRTMVEDNFAAIKSCFGVYSLMPVRLIISLESDILDWRSEARLFWCPSDAAVNEVAVYDAGDITFDRERFQVATPKGCYEARSCESRRAGDVLWGAPTRGTLDYDFPGAVVRRWVYGMLQREYERSGERALLEMYGVKAPQSGIRPWH